MNAVFTQIREQIGGELSPASVFTSDIYSIPGLNTLILNYCNLLFPVRWSTSTCVLGCHFVTSECVALSSDLVMLFYDRLELMKAGLLAYTCPTNIDCCGFAFGAAQPSKKKRNVTGEEKGSGDTKVYVVNNMEYMQGLVLLKNQLNIVSYCIII